MSQHFPRFLYSAQYPQGESNPCLRTENPMSWATRRWGQRLAACPFESLGEPVTLLPLFSGVNRRFLGHSAHDCGGLAVWDLPWSGAHCTSSENASSRFNLLLASFLTVID